MVEIAKKRILKENSIIVKEIGGFEWKTKKERYLIAL